MKKDGDKGVMHKLRGRRSNRKTGGKISTLAEQTVNELAYQSLKDLAKFLSKKLQLPLFMKDEQLENAALCVDIRNIITHNRGIVNRFFAQRHPEFATAVGSRLA